jgi:hypothetical protein
MGHVRPQPPTRSRTPGTAGTFIVSMSTPARSRPDLVARMIKIPGNGRAVSFRVRGHGNTGPARLRPSTRPAPASNPHGLPFLAGRTEADFQAWRYQRDTTAWKYAMWDAGMRMPTQLAGGAAIDIKGASTRIPAPAHSQGG